MIEKLFKINRFWDRRSCRNLVNDERVLEEPRDCESECMLLDGKIASCHDGCFSSASCNCGWGSSYRVHLALLIRRNIISYRKLKQKVFKLSYVNGFRSLVNFKTGAAAFDVQMNDNALVVQAESNRPIMSSLDVIKEVSNEELTASDDKDMQVGTLMLFHQRMTHLWYDII